MDFIYQRERQLASNLPLSETVYQGFRLTASKLSEFPLSANILPLLMNVRLFGIPLEFFNLLIALIAYSSTYPSVFWRVHKGMSLVFSFHLLVYSATVIWTYFSFTILHRIQEINANNLRPVGLGQYLVTSNKFPFYHPYAVIGTFVTTMVLMMLAPITLYTYAYNKYYVNVMTLQAKNRIRSGTGQSEYSAQTNKSYSRISRELCCDGMTIYEFLAKNGIRQKGCIHAIAHLEQPGILSLILLTYYKIMASYCRLHSYCFTKGPKGF